MNRLAGSLLSLGQLDAAERTSREVVSQYAGLVELDPSNLALVRDLCFQRLQWAEVRLAANDRPGTRALLAQVAADLNRLLAADPNAEHLQFSLKGWLYELQALAAPDDPAVAQTLQQWLDDVVPGLQARTPNLGEPSLVRVAAVGLALGDLHAAQGRQAAATRQWQRAQQQVPATTGASEAAKGYRAQLQLRLGDRAGAAALAAELQAAGFVSRNSRDLVRRLALSQGLAGPG